MYSRRGGVQTLRRSPGWCATACRCQLPAVGRRLREKGAGHATGSLPDSSSSVCLAIPTLAAGQAGEGSLRGVVQDDQGGALPGVTVTATSPALFSPSVAVSETPRAAIGSTNLPPGTYVLPGGASRASRRSGARAFFSGPAQTSRWTSSWPSAHWQETITVDRRFSDAGGVEAHQRPDHRCRFPESSCRSSRGNSGATS